MELFVDSGVKRLQVNHAGGYIEINLGDQQLGAKYKAFGDQIKEIGREMTDLQRVNAHAPGDSEDEKKRKNAALDAGNLALCKQMMAAFDATFGEGACKKVFGDIVPGVYAFLDFFEKFVPIFNVLLAEYKADRESRFGKYLHFAEGEPGRG